MEPFSADLIDDLIGELDQAGDSEHPDVAVSADDGWTLSAFPSGLVVWENVESPGHEPRHAHDVARPDLRRLLLAVGTSDLGQVENFDWLPGYR